ncbi:arylsulfatase B [Hyalella azteca]|uniref:Arylsulfatase B n=1 Tax=Hyalella azteca TaxID=294128 RepID=A0A8B7P628_HYAAZ|nr:arylsulfatase B [Hyalella azteca]
MSRTLVIILAVMTTQLSLVWSATTETDRQNSKPHIIYILADDLGFHDVPWHNPLIRAPALQRLVDEGVTLEQSYMLPVCSPSRAALISGRYPHKNGMKSANIKPLQPTGLPLNLTLLPESLKMLGYSTHAVGKWHLGFCKEEYTPIKRGFDSFYGFYTGNLDYYEHSQGTKRVDPSGEKSTVRKASGLDFHSNATASSEAVGKYSTFEFVKKIKSLLRSRDPKDPLFLYAAFQNPHGPLQVPRRFLELYPHEANPKRRIILGMVSALDHAVGSVVAALEETGHFQNSIIVFSSDNGASWNKMGLNWPLRGSKGSLFEGGTRVPAVVSSLRLAQRGVVYTGLFHATDWYPTLLRAAGAPASASEGLDGVDQWEALNGRAPPPRQQMIYQMTNHRGLSTAMRYKNYKVILGNFKDKGWGVPPEYENITEATLEGFLDSGAAMSIVPPRPRINDTAPRYVDQELYLSSSTDMADFGPPVEYDYDGTNDEKLESRDDNARSFPTGNTSVEDEDPGRHARKQGTKADKKERKAQHKAFKRLKPTKIKLKSTQRVVGNRKKDISTFRSANDFLVSGIPIHLYNLADDPYERHNLAEREPEILEGILGRLVPELRKYVEPHEPPTSSAGDPSHFNGVWSSGWC